MNVLFVCNQNQNRSKTAEELFQGRFNTKSCGLFNDNPITVSELEWADTVVVMEEFQRDEIAKRFPREYMMKRVLCLDVPDIYAYDDIKLKKELNEKLTIP